MNILNLPSWAVLETRESDHDYHITVQLTYPPSHCPHTNPNSQQIKSLRRDRS